MNTIIAIAVSGLQAAAKRLQVDASNVANMANRSAVGADGAVEAGLYRPRQVVQVATPGGGVQAFARPVDPAFHIVPAPSAAQSGNGGPVAMPNVDIGEQVVEMIVAKTAYKANAAVIAVAQELDDVLLDIKA